jgi:DNA-binding response OmpR family regulator
VGIISECECSSHYFASSPDYRFRLLYIGNNLSLLKFLKSTLSKVDCFVVRAPTGYVARPFIKNINYSLLLCDKELPDTNALELASFTRAHRECTPLVIFRQAQAFDSLARVIARSLRRQKSTRS